MSASRWIAALIMLVILVVLGGFREVVFVNINEQQFYNDGHIDSYRVLDQFSFLNSWTNESLGTLKWGLTILFSLLFLALGAIVFKFILKDRKGAQWLFWAYLGAFVFAGSSFLIGRLIGMADLGYTLSRVFMGALQSPFILMLMIPARKLASIK